MAAQLYSFTRSGPAQDEDAATRQEIVRTLHEALRGGLEGLKNVPIFVREAFEAKVWQQARIFAGGTHQSPISFHDFVHAPYPTGLGVDYVTVRQFLGRDVEALRLWDEASQRPSGRPETLDNIQGSAPAAPTGTSAQAAIRRLRKDADGGDAKATSLLAQVLAGEVKANRAAVAMGYRPATLTVRDDLEALTEAAIRKGGIVGVFNVLRERMTKSEREAILLAVAAWSPPSIVGEEPAPETADLIRDFGGKA